MTSTEPVADRSPWLKGLAGLGIIVPLAVLGPAWWGRASLDKLSILSYLGCAVAPLPFGAWLGQGFGGLPKARSIMLAGLVLALVGGVIGYGLLISGGAAAAKPPEAMLVVPLGQLLVVVIAAFAAFLFGRR